jgi:uncharacterized protein YcbX
MGKNIVVLRVIPGFKKGLPMNIMKWGSDEDQTRTFVSKCVFHLINEASTRDLTTRVLAKYPDPADREKIKVTSLAFRPNIIIDTGVAYEEDLFQEFRIGSTMVRTVGFCGRCKVVACNYESNQHNPELEPNPTLNSYRKHELGTLFGTYHMVEIIPSVAVF